MGVCACVLVRGEGIMNEAVYHTYNKPMHRSMLLTFYYELT